MKAIINISKQALQLAYTTLALNVEDEKEQETLSNFMAKHIEDTIEVDLATIADDKKETMQLEFAIACFALAQVFDKKLSEIEGNGKTV